LSSAGSDRNIECAGGERQKKFRDAYTCSWVRLVFGGAHSCRPGTYYDTYSPNNDYYDTATKTTPR
jgi:hypothetical protein